jgi:uncharacterized integral membrane protein
MTVPHDPEREHSPEPEPGGRRRDFRLGLSGVLLVLVVWFALANTQEVKIHFWFVQTRSPIIAALAIAGVFGAGIGVLVARRFRRPSS